MVPTAAAEASLFIAIDLDMAMQCALVTTAADFLFAHKPASFQTNPANTLSYAALKSLEDRSIVHVVELLRSPIMKDGISGLRHLDALTLHRDAVSHPYVVEWRRREMQEFHDAKRKYLDVRAALLWDLNASIDEQLVAEGSSPRNDVLRPTAESAMLLSTILRLSMLPEAGPPNEQLAEEMLAAFRPRFLDFVVHKTPKPTAQ